MELVGNALCLDLANTVNERPVPERDWIDTPDGLAAWAGLVGRAPGGTVEQARDLRESIYRVFSALTRDAAPPPRDLKTLFEVYAAALPSAAFARDGAHGSLRWPAGHLLGEAAASAVDLLTHGPLDRLGECPSCGWLFVDTSRNGQRRWCSMAMCGGRVKARRHHARTRDEAQETADRSG
ncbi:ABATE domain-containing protein [Longispora sp. NPDC051575]|uniref:CGNR zinc finger domain-containing protein n=1 Tax=Longispora sp. NPDC051575 TaxID=3154943 RepID=UPI0034240F2F